MGIEKRQINEDVFTDITDAVYRSQELGFNGRVHSIDVDGQRMFRPGGTPDEEDKSKDGGKVGMIVSALMDYAMKSDNSSLQSPATVLKVDSEQRIVWGWASVTTVKGELVYDAHNDSISTDEMVKAANDFMLDVRTAKAMHEGGKVGEVIHSLPLTKELGDSLGLQCDREGWIIAMKIHSDRVWEKVKSGEFGAFSIGGRAKRNAQP